MIDGYPIAKFQNLFIKNKSQSGHRLLHKNSKKKYSLTSRLKVTNPTHEKLQHMFSTKIKIHGCVPKKHMETFFSKKLYENHTLLIQLGDIYFPYNLYLLQILVFHELICLSKTNFSWWF